MRNKTNIEEDIKIVEEMLKDKEEIIKYHTWIGSNALEAFEETLRDVRILSKKANKYDSLVEKIENKIKILNKKEKEELRGTKSQDRYYIKQEYMYKRNILQELLDTE